MSKKVVQIRTSSNTFMVDRMVFTNHYPELKGDNLRVYLLMCRAVGFNSTFFMGVNVIEKEVNLSTHHVNKALMFLENNFFIKKCGKVGRANKYVVLTVPLYDSATKSYISRESIPRTRYDLKDFMNGYSEMPIEIMKGSILKDKTLWTDRKIKVLMMMYSYHYIDMFGGVDSAVMYGTISSIFVDDFIAHQIGCHTNDVKKTIQTLIRDGYAFKVDTVYRINKNSCVLEKQFVGDLTKVILQPGDDVVSIIRMTRIPDIKLGNALIRTQGAIEL